MYKTINTLLVSKPDKNVPLERQDYYHEQVRAFKQKVKPKHTADIINLLLFNQRGQVLIQKRSDRKDHNPDLLDKSLGAHILFGDTAFYTVMVRLMQELRLPSIVLSTQDDFQKTYKLLYSHLQMISVIKHVNTSLVEIERLINKENIPNALKLRFFLGVFHGPMKPVDTEVEEMLEYDIDKLNKEISAFPNEFTQDLKFLLQNYSKEIKEFIQEISTPVV